ncbi:Formyl-CoA:oxalate CoA-transferase [Candidatus Entotheonellaceae bacterium PAL068K]
MTLSDDKGVAVCFDPIGGGRFDAALSLLGWGGRLLLIGFAGGRQQIPAHWLLIKNRAVLGCARRYFRWHVPDKLVQSVEELRPGYGERKLKPCVTQCLPWERRVHPAPDRLARPLLMNASRPFWQSVSRTRQVNGSIEGDHMGPLTGVKIVEFGGIGPPPMAAMLLADMGAEVLRIDRIRPSGLGFPVPPRFSVMDRSRRSVGIDLKMPEGLATVLRLLDQAEALIEGFRPGVMERLGLGPQVCLARNPRLVYGRVTGWGQTGPLAHAAGHDLNYIALTGTAHAIGRRGQPPTPPLNLVGDFGGGALYLALGIVAALYESQHSGQGQVVDAAMVDGAASLMASIYGLHAAGVINDRRGENLVDSGSPFYEVYETADQKFISIAAIEAKFYAELLLRLGLENEALPEQMDREHWPALTERLAQVFRTKTRQEWCDILEGTDVCFAPILSFDEAPQHPHNQARDTFIAVDGVVQPAPAPRFSRTPAQVQRPPAAPGEHTQEGLSDWGFSQEEIATLRKARAIA